MRLIVSPTSPLGMERVYPHSLCTSRSYKHALFMSLKTDPKTTLFIFVKSYTVLEQKDKMHQLDYFGKEAPPVIGVNMMKIFGIHWILSGGNNSQIAVTVDDEPDAPAGKWEVQEAYNKMKRPTTQLMALTVSQCHDLIRSLKARMKDEGVDTDDW